MVSMSPINDWVNVAAVRSELPVTREQSGVKLTDLRVRESHPRFSRRPQILLELLPPRRSSGLPNSSEGQTATGDFGDTARDRRETQLPLDPRDRSRAMPHRGTPGPDKTIRGARHNKVRPRFQPPSPNA